MSQMDASSSERKGSEIAFRPLQEQASGTCVGDSCVMPERGTSSASMSMSKDRFLYFLGGCLWHASSITYDDASDLTEVQSFKRELETSHEGIYEHVLPQILSLYEVYHERIDRDELKMALVEATDAFIVTSPKGHKLNLSTFYTDATLVEAIDAIDNVDGCIYSMLELVVPASAELKVCLSKYIQKPHSSAHTSSELDQAMHDFSTIVKSNVTISNPAMQKTLDDLGAMFSKSFKFFFFSVP